MLCDFRFIPSIFQSARLEGPDHTRVCSEHSHTVDTDSFQSAAKDCQLWSYSRTGQLSVDQVFPIRVLQKQVGRTAGATWLSTCRELHIKACTGAWDWLSCELSWTEQDHELPQPRLATAAE